MCGIAGYVLTNGPANLATVRAMCGICGGGAGSGAQAWRSLPRQMRSARLASIAAEREAAVEAQETPQLEEQRTA